MEDLLLCMLLYCEVSCLVSRSTFVSVDFPFLDLVADGPRSYSLKSVVTTSVEPCIGGPEKCRKVKVKGKVLLLFVTQIKTKAEEGAPSHFSHTYTTLLVHVYTAAVQVVR